VDRIFGNEFKKKYLSLQKILYQEFTDGLGEEEQLQRLIENY